MALIHGPVGLQAYAAGSGNQPIGADRLGAALISHAHARYANLARAGLLFTSHNVAAQAVSVALATTYTGLVLSNPNGNTKQAIILGVGFALSVAPAAIASLHVIRGFSTTDTVHTTPLAAPGIQNGLIGASAAASTMKADSAATIATPSYGLPIMGGFTAAALPSSPLAWLDLSGMYVLDPGGFIALGALTAVTGFAAIAHYEVDR